MATQIQSTAVGAFDRRGALAKLGLSGGAVYLTPILLTLSEAETNSGGGRAEGADAGSRAFGAETE